MPRNLPVGAHVVASASFADVASTCARADGTPTIAFDIGDLFRDGDLWRAIPSGWSLLWVERGRLVLRRHSVRRRARAARFAR